MFYTTLCCAVVNRHNNTFTLEETNESGNKNKQNRFLSKANFVFILFTYFYLCQPLAKLYLFTNYFSAPMVRIMTQEDFNRRYIALEELVGMDIEIDDKEEFI